MIDYIREHLSEEDLLCQLAEEASELAQAALKVVRIRNGSNPTPVSEQQANENLGEEIVDISVCLAVLGLCNVDPEGDVRFAKKLKRWCERLEALHGGTGNE